MHRLKSSTKFTTWNMNYVVFSLSSFIMISSPNMFLARETHMHSFFNFHTPKYFPVSPIFPNSLLNLIGACLSACRDSQHLFVCLFCLLNCFRILSTFVFSVGHKHCFIHKVYVHFPLSDLPPVCLFFQTRS